MSSSSITYDVLSMNELKPWWEEVRTYALALMLASSLFLSYNFETSGAVDCRPFNRTSASMESADTSFVNSVCVSDYNSAALMCAVSNEMVGTMTGTGSVQMTFSRKTQYFAMYLFPDVKSLKRCGARA